MVKAIKFGKIEQVECSSCDAVLEFEKQDVRFAKGESLGCQFEYKYIECPICKNKVTVKEDNI